MKLKITDYFWAVGQRTKRLKTIYAPLVKGEITALNEKSGCKWNIDEVGESFVKVSFLRHNGETIKEWTIEKGKGEYWRPRSMDAGHEYRIKLVRFF